MENSDTISESIDNDGSESDATILFQDCFSDDVLSEISDSHVDFMLDQSFLVDNDEHQKVLENLNKSLEKNQTNEKSNGSDIDDKNNPISNKDKESSGTSESDESESSEENDEGISASKSGKEKLINQFVMQSKKNHKKGNIYI
jgi:hypothetical protein